MRPEDEIIKHFRITPMQVSALKRLGLVTIEDLLRHCPARYETGGASVRVSALTVGSKVTLFGTLSKLKAKKLWKSRRNITEGWFEDASGKVKVMWLNQPYMASYVPQTALVKVSGTVGGKEDRPYIANPEVEAIPAGAAIEGMFAGDTEPKGASVFPVYPETRGITSKWFYHALERVFASDILKHIADPIPSAVRDRYHLPNLTRSLLAMHRPSNPREAEAARKRFAFEEIFSVP